MHSGDLRNWDGAISLAQQADAVVLAALTVEVWLDTYAQNGVTQGYAEHVMSAYAPSELAGQMKTAGISYLVFKQADHVLGYAKVVLGAKPVSETSGTAELETLYIRRHHQGQGIGRKLLERAADLVRQNGHSKMFVTVFNENARALGFYQSNGFVEAGEFTFMLNGSGVPNVILTRDLKA